MIQLSIIVPVYKENKTISKLLHHLNKNLSRPEFSEIIIVDFNGSTQVDKGTCIYINSPVKGRAAQMNYGARIARSSVYYFLHADSIPPKNFDLMINSKIELGSNAGTFRMRFDNNHCFLNFFAWFTRFNNNWCRGGDQSLFITKGLFDKIGAFNDSFHLMEDIEIVERIKRNGTFSIIKEGEIITSARKYNANGIYRLQFLFGLLHLQYRLGYSQQSMCRFYKKHILTN